MGNDPQRTESSLTLLVESARISRRTGGCSRARQSGNRLQRARLSVPFNGPHRMGAVQALKGRAIPGDSTIAESGPMTASQLGRMVARSIPDPEPQLYSSF